MRILAIDGDPRPWICSRACLRQACPQGELHPFSSGHKALAWLKTTGAGFDAAFLEVALPEMSGVALARQLQARCPRGNLIFVTEFPQYMGEAFDLHASGYLMKPVTVPEVQRELADPALPRPGGGPSAAGAGLWELRGVFPRAARCTSAAAGPRSCLPTSSTAGGRGAPWGN